MNERIKELMDYAVRFRLDPDSNVYEAQVQPEDLELFAVLLIRECVKEIEFQYGGGSDQPMDNEWDRAIECVSSMVK